MAVHRGNRWTPEEEERLRKLLSAKASPTLMAAKLNRSVEAIRMRVIVLRRKEKRSEPTIEPKQV